MNPFPPIKTRIAGVSFENPDGSLRQAFVRQVKRTDRLVLRREPHNPFDPEALAVDWPDAAGTMHQLGYVPRALALVLSPLLDAGTRLDATVVRSGNASQGLGLVGVRMAIAIDEASLPPTAASGLEPLIARATNPRPQAVPDALAPELGSRPGPARWTSRVALPGPASPQRPRV